VHALPPEPSLKQHSVSKLDFEAFQQSKANTTMLLFDHERMGIEKLKMLESLKEWFFYMKQSNDDDGDMDDDTIESYTMPVSEVGQKAVQVRK